MFDRVRLRFVALGDSLTVGFQSPDVFLPGREEFPYTSLLEVILSSELPKKNLSNVEVSFVNAGMMGDTTRGMLERFEAHVASEEPDYVLVWGGINDLYMLQPPEAVFGNLKRIYGRTREIGAEPIACTVTSVLGDEGMVTRIRELNELIKGHCEENGIPVADLFSATNDEAGRLRETFSSDGVHLSYAGYHRVAYAIYHQVIEPILDGWKR